MSVSVFKNGKTQALGELAFKSLLCLALLCDFRQFPSLRVSNDRVG